MLPLIDVSPREAYLEQRVKELEAENQYLRQSTQFPRHSVMNEPETMAVPHTIISSVSLPIATSVSVTDDRDALHILVQEKGFGLENFRLHYCISRIELLTARDRAGILQFLNERALREIGNAFFGFNRS